MKKINNKILLLVLVALAAGYLALKFFRGSRDTNLPVALVRVDTAAVTEIKIYPKDNNFEEISLLREGKNWKVKEKDKTASTDKGVLPSLLTTFPLKPVQLISKSKDKWKEYQVSDTSTRVKVMKGSEVVADFRIGKIEFLPMQGQQFGSGNIGTCVRNSDDQKTYVVQGFLESTFNKPYNEWRDKTFLKVDKNEISKIAIRYPRDSGFVLEKASKKWIIGKEMADTTKVASYLSQWENVRATKYQDEAPAGSPDITIQVFAGLNELAHVNAWRKENAWTMQSSQREDVYFTSQGLDFLLKKKKELKLK